MKICNSCIFNYSGCNGYVPTGKTGFLTCENYKSKETK